MSDVIKAIREVMAIIMGSESETALNQLNDELQVQPITPWSVE